jgi:flagellar protein FlaJ
MGFYTKTAMRMFGQVSEASCSYFTDLKSNLKCARIKMSVQEYLSVGILTSFIVFLAEFPLLSLIIAILIQSLFSESSVWLFAFISSFTLSIFLTIIFFFAFINYPRVIIKERGRRLENTLPFASLYLSTLFSSRLPLYSVFNIFSKHSNYGEITEEITAITNDMDVFGLDINTALERGIERSSSKNFKEILWGVLSINRSGGDINVFLKEKAKGLMEEHRRRMFEFSHQLTMYIEVYLTAVIMGAIFFSILTSIMSGLSGVGSQSVFLQFVLIFIFLPAITAVFIILIRSSAPGSE